MCFCSRCQSPPPYQTTLFSTHFRSDTSAIIFFQFHLRLGLAHNNVRRLPSAFFLYVKRNSFRRSVRAYAECVSAMQERCYVVGSCFGNNLYRQLFPAHLDAGRLSHMERKNKCPSIHRTYFAVRIGISLYI